MKFLSATIEKIKRHKIIAMVLFVLFVAFFFFIWLFTQPTLRTAHLSDYSTIKKRQSSMFISLYAATSYLYKTHATGQSAAQEFMEKNPPFQPGKRLLPADFAKNSQLIKSVLDKDDSFLNSRNIHLNSEHYIFNQTIQGIPVYAGTIHIHIRNSNEIYGINGNLVTRNLLTPEKLSKSQAEEIAQKEASREAGVGVLLKITDSKKMIVNRQILGISEDGTNYVTRAVTIISDTRPVTFNTQYFIDLSTGTVIHKEEKIFEALARNIYSCSPSGSCPLARSEGQNAVGDAETDAAYDYFKTVYDFYKTSFGRDSYDNLGAPLNGYVHYTTGSQIPSGLVERCPNAFWDSHEMVYCSNMVVLDITGHELTHAVVGATVGPLGLMSGYQSLALNESIADIFGSALDGNWTLGEGSALEPLGLLRDMSDPPRFKDFTGTGQPDRIFSPNYYCGTADRGGGHHNNGILNKAFYVMTVGGSFNTCTVTGIGRQKANAIMYRVLQSGYLTIQSNYKDMYAAVQSSCNDLYQTNSSTCREVKRAFRATEMDQQVAASQLSPVCSGGTAAPVRCEDTTPPAGATSTPTPVAQSSPTPLPSSYSVVGSVFIDSNGNTQRDPGEVGYPGAELDLSGSQTATTLSNSNGDFSFLNLSSGSYAVSLTINNQVIQSTSTFSLSAASPKVTVPFALPPTYLTPTPSVGSSTTTPTSPATSTAPPAPPSGSAGGDTGEEVVLYECHEVQTTQTVNGQQLQISSLKCCPLNQPNC